MLAAMNKTPGKIAIFTAGKHVAVDGRVIDFSEQDIAEIAATYDPALAEAPMVVGHPSLTAPAYGWAKTLSADGPVLYAEPHQVEPAFAEAVNAGRYKKRSASIYLRDTPGNPTPGKLYLRHIGWLGASAPAVKGLRDVQFAEDSGAAEFSLPVSYFGRTVADVLQRLRDWFVEKEGVEKADTLIPQWQIRNIDEIGQDAGDAQSIPAVAYAAPAAGAITMETSAMSQTAGASADFAEREAALQTRSAELTQRERAIQERESKARRDDAVAFAERLASQAEGKLLPRQVPAVVELLLALPAQPISFAEGATQVSKPGDQLLRELLDSLPRQVDYTEKSGKAGESAPASFAAPAGAVVSASRSELYRRAKEHQAANPGVSWADAVEAVGG